MIVDENNFSTEEVSISEINPPDTYFKVSKEEIRKDWMHKTTHFIALIVILSFLMMLFGQIIFRPNNVIIPDYLISIVSVVVGFYFAKSLPFGKEKN